MSFAIPSLPGSRGEIVSLKRRKSSAVCNFTGPRACPLRRMLPFPTAPPSELTPKIFSLIDVHICEPRVLDRDAHCQKYQLIVAKGPVAQVEKERRGSQNAAPHEYVKCR